MYDTGLPTRMALPSRAEPVPDRALARYALGVAVTVGAVLSQYVVPQHWGATRPLFSSLYGDLLVVYGLPILAFGLLVGGGPLRGWAGRMGVAAREGLVWYATLFLLALAVVVALAVVYELLDPSALALLHKPNPVVSAAASDPWLFVGLSFFVGAVEELIFRGWMFGFWAGRSTPWVVPAAWTSAVFAGVHLYYGLTYGPAAPLIYPTLFLAGFAFAATYRFSGGNLVVPALLHGQMDATAYLGLISNEAALAIRYGVVAVGAVLALLGYLRPRTGAAAPASIGPPGVG